MRRRHRPLGKHDRTPARGVPDPEMARRIPRHHARRRVEIRPAVPRRRTLRSEQDRRRAPAGRGPFRSVVRNELDFPGAKNFAYSKVPAVSSSRARLSAALAIDGSVANPTTRSLIAAYTSGASLAGLANPAVAHNVRAAAAYTESHGARDRHQDRSPRCSPPSPRPIPPCRRAGAIPTCAIAPPATVIARTRRRHGT